MPVRSLINAGQGAFVLGLDRLPLALKSGIDGERFDALQLFFKIRDPSITDFAGNESAQLRIAEHDPTPRRYAIGHVEELLRNHCVEVPEHGLLEQSGVERRDAVDRVTADAGKMRHAHVLFSRFINQ